MNNLILREWNQKTIRQSKDGQYLSGTDMCSSCNKKFNDWYRLLSTDAYLKALSDVTGIPVTTDVKGTQALIYSIQGGNPQEQGTWIHRKVAIRLAQWLSPELAVQVDSWIEELFETGKVELTQHPENQTPMQVFEMIHQLSGKLMTEFNSIKNEQNQQKEILETTISDVELLKQRIDEFRFNASVDDSLPIALNVYCKHNNINLGKSLTGVGKSLTRLCKIANIEFNNNGIAKTNTYPIGLLRILFKTSADFDCNAESLLTRYLAENN